MADNPVIAHPFAGGEVQAPCNPLNQAPLPTLNSDPTDSEELVNGREVPDND